MSHAKERHEKNCLNCNAEIYGRYCHNCGQENREPKETVWGLITHFFYDITHFDGNFFSTLKYLAIKPGFLSAEYIRGRRASYLNPIRMYVFTSAFFFIIFFSITNFDPLVKSPGATIRNDSSRLNNLAQDSGRVLNRAQRELLKYAANKKDSLDIMEGFSAASDSLTRKRKGLSIGMTPNEYRSLAHYDSTQKMLPAAERDGWFQRIMQRKQIDLVNKYGDDQTVVGKVWLNAFIHRFPALLFVSLPIFALILKLLYVRRKQFYYADHGIFTIHLYIFSFIVLLVAIAISKLASATGWGFINWLHLPLWLYLIYYDYKAMRNFYGQGTAKTLVKFILLNTLALITIIILFGVFFVIAAFQL